MHLFLIVHFFIKQVLQMYFLIFELEVQMYLFLLTDLHQNMNDIYKQMKIEFIAFKQEQMTELEFM